MRITPDITVEELLEHFPEANGYLIEHGLPCLVCGEPFWGTLRDLALRNGVEDVDELVRGLVEFLDADSEADLGGAG